WSSDVCSSDLISTVKATRRGVFPGVLELVNLVAASAATAAGATARAEAALATRQCVKAVAVSQQFVEGGQLGRGKLGAHGLDGRCADGSHLGAPVELFTSVARGATALHHLGALGVLVFQDRLDVRLLHFGQRQVRGEFVHDRLVALVGPFLHLLLALGVAFGALGCFTL